MTVSKSALWKFGDSPIPPEKQEDIRKSLITALAQVYTAEEPSSKSPQPSGQEAMPQPGPKGKAKGLWERIGSSITCPGCVEYAAASSGVHNRIPGQCRFPDIPEVPPDDVVSPISPPAAASDGGGDPPPKAAPVPLRCEACVDGLSRQSRQHNRVKRTMCFYRDVYAHMCCSFANGPLQK